MNTTITPARLSAREAMTFLGIKDRRTWRKVIDANPAMVHRLPGEDRPKYLTGELKKLIPTK
jgi:hypothetical protein